ncbi:jg9249 [Pararge aegeria aegeria]|uniref:Jg9249 protein n=1 Tax=Pararge aegeria aegeria TaxID=348720 RepID=A0A8S4QT81_9NEOP|nr:jg9249 [Pararge aegeria aegeria]
MYEVHATGIDPTRSETDQTHGGQLVTYSPSRGDESLPIPMAHGPFHSMARLGDHAAEYDPLDQRSRGVAGFNSYFMNIRRRLPCCHLRWDSWLVAS